MNASKKRLWITCAIAIVVVLIILIWVIAHSSNTATDVTPASTASVVQTTTIKTAVWQQPIHVVGTVANQHQVAVSAESDGRVTRIAYKPDTNVQRGQVLFELFNADLKAQWASDKANLQKARLDYERTLMLYRSGNATAAMLDRDKQAYQSALATSHQTQAQLSKTVVRAPIAGRAGLNTVNVGDYVKTGSLLTNLTPNTPLRVDFAVPGRYDQTIHVGDTVYYATQNQPNTFMPMTLQAINTAINQQDRHLACRALFQKPVSFKPGQFLSVLLHVGKPESVFVVPETAVQYALGGAFVFLVKDNKAVQVPVTVMQLRGHEAGVQGKLQTGDTVVSINQPSLHAGETIRVVQ